MRYIHTIEYSPLGKIPKKKDNEHEFNYFGNIMRVSIAEGDSPTQIKESFNPIFNESKLEEQIIPLQNIVIVDDLDIQKPEQRLVYVYECPVCLNHIVSTDSNCYWCPQCENQTYDLNLVAIIDKELLDEMAVEDADATTIICVKGDKIVKKIEQGKEY